VILLDTHVLVWLDEANPRLGAGAIERINVAFHNGETMVSAISFWEVSMLVKKKRIKLDLDLSVWRNDFIEQGLIELPVTGDIGIQAVGLDSFHGDPADRLIAATALKHSLTLVTADQRLLNYHLATARLDARI